MAFSTQRAVSDGTLVLLGVSIEYIKQADISVFYDGLPADDATWNWVGSTTNIAFTPAVPNGVEVLLKRTTQIDKVINRFTAGAGFNNASMDTDFAQMLYLNQEAVEGAALTDIFNDVDFHGNKVTNVGDPVDPGDALNLSTYNTLAANLVSEVTVIKEATEAVYDSFDDRYLGPKAVEPTTDNDGNALINGALYWDTVIGGGVMRVWQTSAWSTIPANTAAAVSVVPAGGITEPNVQGALDGLEARKASFDWTTYGGTANAVVLTPNFPRAAYSRGDTYRFRATATNTGATTIKVGALAAIAARTVTGVALPANYIRTDADTVCVYDGTNFIVSREVERGSNANGEYIRYAHGEQRCWAIPAVVSRAMTSAFGALFVLAAPATRTFPVAFSVPPVVNPSISTTGGSTRISAVTTSATTTTYSFDLLSVASATFNVGDTYTATGYWY